MQSAIQVYMKKELWVVSNGSMLHIFRNKIFVQLVFVTTLGQTLCTESYSMLLSDIDLIKTSILTLKHIYIIFTHLQYAT